MYESDLWNHYTCWRMPAVAKCDVETWSRQLFKESAKSNCDCEVFFKLKFNVFILCKQIKSASSASITYIQYRLYYISLHGMLLSVQLLLLFCSLRCSFLLWGGELNSTCSWIGAKLCIFKQSLHIQVNQLRGEIKRLNSLWTLHLDNYPELTE